MIGINRLALMKCRDEGFARCHGNKGRKRISKLDGYAPPLDARLKVGISNIDVLFRV